MGGEATVFYRPLADLLSRKSNVIYSRPLLLWLGWDAHCPFLQLQCTFVVAGPSLIDLSMSPQRWAWLMPMVQGTTDWQSILLYTCFSYSCLAHHTFVLGWWKLYSQSFKIRRKSGDTLPSLSSSTLNSLLWSGTEANIKAHDPMQNPGETRIAICSDFGFKVELYPATIYLPQFSSRYWSENRPQ